jgi:hypothetical protein
MTEEEFNNIILISQKYNNVLIHIDEFCDILRRSPPLFDPFTQMDILKTGLYARMTKCNIWVGAKINNLTSGVICVSNVEVSNCREIDKWSPSVPLALAHPEYLARVANLKAFW